MTTKEHREKVLECLRWVWENNPYLRLGQLVLNVSEDETVLYYMTDKELVKKLRRYPNND